MGLFSLFRSKDPDKVASELVASALVLELGPEEHRWVKVLGVEVHRYIAERNALRVGMTQAGVTLSIGDVKHMTSPKYKLELAVERKFEQYFMAMPKVTPEEGRGFYRALSSRYIVRPPAEMVGIFHFYLLNPGAWRDHDIQSTPDYGVPEGFQSFVHALMRQPLKNGLDRANELGE
ncbi:hypothetical protein [Hydrogenophaga sp.]|uniref:hypothetical protein n=1 Tax=Hydrogenophaga sp. TaxID=1904254 RepID=UPI002723F99A|nr:hypothetical protein [Hydrogenophaga sp.]MDO9134018.1 hypothetical protein [Hydrogenophaga sp.]